MNKFIAIELGNVVPGATLLGQDSGINETFVGHIDCTNQRYKAYIKVLNDKQLVNELLANTLGRLLNLPIPRGFLLRVKPSDLPESNLLKNFNQEALVFGSQALKYPSLARKYRGDSIEVIKWLKANFKILDETIIFDDFVANVDRNQGNLLVDGGGDVWLIDHGSCFTGSNWDAQHLIADGKYNNLMADAFIGNMTLSERIKLKNKASMFCDALGKVDKRETINSCYINQIIPATELGALESFVIERVAHIVSIVSERVGIPTLGGGI